MKSFLKSKKASLIGFLVIVALIMGAFLIIRSKNYDIKRPGDLFSFLGDFFSWLFQLGKNIYNLVGYTVKQNWTPEGVNLSNITNITEK